MNNNYGNYKFVTVLVLTCDHVFANTDHMHGPEDANKTAYRLRMAEMQGFTAIPNWQRNMSIGESCSPSNSSVCDRGNAICTPGRRSEDPTTCQCKSGFKWVRDESKCKRDLAQCLSTSECNYGENARCRYTDCRTTKTYCDCKDHFVFEKNRKGEDICRKRCTPFQCDKRERREYSACCNGLVNLRNDCTAKDYLWMKGYPN